MVGKQGCSFKETKWGIAKGPKLTTTAAGKIRRAREAQKKKQKTAGEESGIATQESIAGTQESVSAVVTRSRRKGKGKAVVNEPVPSSSRAPVLTSLPVAESSAAAGKTFAIFMEDLLVYEHALNNPDRTSLGLELSAAELRRILVREHADAGAMVQLFNTRAKLIERLLDDYDGEISRLDEGGSDDAEGDSV
jgi:hypothetical protein